MKIELSGTSALSPCQIIAWNLERARRSRGWTQEQAAGKLEPYLGYRLSRAAFSQAERCLYGKLRHFDADEIVAFARAFEVPIAYFFVPPQPHFRGKAVQVNGKSGNPKAHISSPPLTRQQMVMLAQGLPDGQSKTVRRGRRPWAPRDLAQVEAVAEREGNMAEIARSLGIDPATLYRKMQNSPEFSEAIRIGRQKRAFATTIALYETEVPVTPRKLDRRSAILFYLKTHPVWRHRNDTTVETSLDSPPGGRVPSAEELKLIHAMTAQERQEIDAICERARQRLSHPEVKATTQAVGYDAEMERLKTPTARGSLDSDATPANNSLKPPENAQESMRTNANAPDTYNAMLRKLSLSRQMGTVGETALPRDFESCPKCGRRPTPSEEPMWINGILVWHNNCRPVPLSGSGSVQR